MSELKPCPFCGGEAKVQYQIHKVGVDFLDWYGVYCKNPFCGHVCGYDTEAEAIVAWNTRAKRTCKNTVDSNYFRCSVCRKKTYRGEEVFNYCPNCGARVIKSDQDL